MTDSRLILLGASIRSPAQSAALSQIPSCGADLFADTDCQAATSVQQIHDYPREFVAFAEKATPSVWMYSGALENHPQIVERLSKTHALAGNSASVLAKVRDLDWLAQHARHCGLRVPRTLSLKEYHHQQPPGRWLCKPRRSSAGLGIEELSLQKSGNGPRDSRSHVAQQRIEGVAGSCVMLSTWWPSGKFDCEILGMTRSVTPAGPASKLPSHEFLYQGSYGPLPLGSNRQLLADFGDEVTKSAKICGLWCVDFIENDGLHLLEINPRWSASMEVLERHQYCSLIPLHLRACQPTMSAAATELVDKWLNCELPVGNEKPVRLCWGKRIVYSHRSVVVDTNLLGALQPGDAPPSDWPPMADVPRLGVSVKRGHPLCTVFASAEAPEDVPALLNKREALVLEMIERTVQANPT